ncbi:benzoate/H(+) symporter BenE family transporter [Salinibacterium sp. PAMC 21357]|uniref:benzoate/H(+) symporter BenE family transporter n=1 Tax=Salinibacterium sp. PAMC 21357 TaxID=1112215 RepID=UPI0002885242|nr:benzoate/H(+) symporter BenE family transporter [Salinibacterium sp. PAMC 21357]
MSRRVSYSQLGGPEVLTISDVNEPHAGEGEVRVRVKFAGINPFDAKVFGGKGTANPQSISFPNGNGTDFAGVVDELGEGVVGWAIGDEVLGGKGFSAQADYVVVPAAKLVLKPASLGWEQAGSLDVAGRTAWASVESLSLTSTDTVLVSAAAGGVGVIAAQLAKLKGAKVIGSASESNHEFLRSLGIHPVTYGEGMVERILEISPEGITAALDNNGRETVDAALALGAPAGRINTIADYGASEKYGATTVGAAGAGTDDLAALSALVAAGTVRCRSIQYSPLSKFLRPMRSWPRGILAAKSFSNSSRNQRVTTTIFQLFSTGVIAAIAGFAASFTLVIAGLQAVGASEAQSASGLLILTVLMGLATIGLAWRYRMPITVAWSTPGAALLIVAADGSMDFRSAVGAFIVCAALIMVSGLVPALRRLVTSIPQPIASAMLAGILFTICLAPITASVEFPWLGLPMVIFWLVLLKVAPRWAVPGALVAAVVAIVLTTEGALVPPTAIVPQLTLVTPDFDPIVMVSLGIPLFIVTMAGQNVPGFTVMRTYGYTVPAGPALAVTGATSAVGAFFGGHVVNLAAITAALTASEEAHDDRSKRWIASVVAGATYVVIGLGAGFATALVSMAPPIVVVAIAGLAVVGALIASVRSALEAPEHRIAAISTFLVASSGITVLGVGSAFWALIVGAAVMAWLGWQRKSRSQVF